MVSFDHEFLVQLFRDNAALAAELLERCAGISVEHTRIELRSIDLSQVTSTEYRADAVAVLYGHSDRPVLGVVVEVQLRDDPDKQLTWPVYVAALRAKFRCAVVLLVVAPESRIAAWARQPIELGHPGFRLTPIVIGFDDVPRVRDRMTASNLPELAVLSTMAHPELEIAKAAIGAVTQLQEDRARLYLDVIMNALPEAIRQRVEAQMQHYEYRSDFARKYYGQGLRAAVIAFARGKLGELSAEDIAALEAVTEPARLTGLVASLGEAATAGEARAALDRVIGR